MGLDSVIVSYFHVDTTEEAGIYLVCLLDLTDLLTSSWVVRREDFPTDRVLPLIVDKNLKNIKYIFFLF